LFTYLGVSFVAALVPCVASYRLMRRFVPFQALSFSWRRASWLVRESVPIGAVNIVLIMYLAVDVILLSRLAGESAAGIYAAPMRIFGTLLFAPTINATVLFPRLSATAVSDRASFARLCDGAIRVILGVTVLAALGASTVGRGLMVEVFGGEFADSGPVLLVMAVALVPTSLNMIAHRMLVALNRQGIWTWVMLGALAIKVVLDVALIPAFDRATGNPALGAAAALALAEAAMMVVALRLLPAGLLGGGLGRHAARLAVVALASMAAAYLLEPRGALQSGLGTLGVFVTLSLVTVTYTPRQLVAAARVALGRGIPAATMTFAQEPAYEPLLWERGRMKQNRPASHRRGLRLVDGSASDWMEAPQRTWAATVPGPRRR
jgi:O-antigen/teichoic acid export membrane protein